MKELFTSEFFAGNRARLRQLVKTDGLIVITANGLMQRSADNMFPFHQDPNFWYLTGIDEPDIILVISEKEDYLIVPPRDTVREMFDGSVSFDNLKKISGIKKVLNEKEGWELLGEQLKKTKQFATLAANPPYVKFYGMFTMPSRRRLIQKVKRYNQKIKLVDIRLELATLRMIKQHPEIKAIQTAIDITIDSLKVALGPEKLAAYKYEYELEAEISYGFRRLGAKGHAFEPIVAAGPNAVTIHSLANNSPIKSGDLIILDVGADFNHYAADISRTIAKSQPSARQKTIYATVLEAENYAFSLLKPGISYKKYEKQMETFVGRKLLELGIIKAANRQTIRQFFPHRTSHFLGLDPHDAGDYEQPLQPGMVLAVEPGIYIPEENIGVRIEDDVLITPTGHKVLSKKLGRALL